MNHYGLEIEPEPEKQDGVPEGKQMSLIPDATPSVPALAGVFPPDFPIFTLLRFLPDPALKKRADALAAQATAIKVEGHDGVTAASVALVPLRDQLTIIRASFKDPKSLAHQVHKRLTGLEEEFCRAGDAAITIKGREIYDEQARLKRITDDARRKAQEEADRQTREAAAAAAKEAAKAGAAKTVVEALKQAAKTATAAPVASPQPEPKLVGMTTVERWKARFKGTLAGAEPNPEMAALTPVQVVQARKLLRAAADGKAPLVTFEINWSELNKRAASEYSTLDIPEIEAFDAGGTRKK